MLLFLTGITYTLWGTNALSTIQLEAPEHLRGRAAALYFFAFLGGAPLGGLLCGWLTATGGTQLAFAAAGVIAIGHRGVGHRAPAPDGASARGDRGRLSQPAGRPIDSIAAAARSTSSSSIPRCVTRRMRDPSGVRARTSRVASSSSAWAGSSREHDVRLRRREPEAARRARARGGGRRRAGRRARARRGRPRRGCPPCASSRRRGGARATRAAAIVASSPASSAPNGAHRPLFRLSATVSTGAASAASGTPSATAAFGSRAPSRWTRAPCFRAAAASASVRATSVTVPPARVCVFSRQSSAAPERRNARSTHGGIEPAAVGVDGERRQARQLRDAERLARHHVGRALDDDRLARDALREQRRRGSPSCTSGRRRPPPSRAAPRRAAPARSRSRPRRRSPSRARAARIASHISSVGGAQKSDRRSTVMRRAQVPPGPRAGVLAGLDDRHAVHEHLVDALARRRAGARASSRRRAGRGRARRGRPPCPAAARRGRERPKCCAGIDGHLADRLLERQRLRPRRRGA